MQPNLIYNIPEESLSGRIGATVIACAAGSGGRAGTKTAGAENWWLANNAFATRVHAGGHIFGPLPQGLYYMRPHEAEAHMVRLDPFASNLMYGRSGFLIHGRGKIGSHGCIVPYEFSNVLKICTAVRHYLMATGSMPVLKVIAASADLDRKLYTA